MNRRTALKSLAAALPVVAGAAVASSACCNPSPSPRTFLPDGIDEGVFEEMASCEEYEHLEDRLGVIHVRWRIWEKLFAGVRRPTRADIHRVLQLPADAIVIGWGRSLVEGSFLVTIAHASLPVTPCGQCIPCVWPEYEVNEDESLALVSMRFSEFYGMCNLLPGRFYLS